MTFCPNCGTENPDNAKYCYNCQSSLDPNTQVINQNIYNNNYYDNSYDSNQEPVSKLTWFLVVIVSCIPLVNIIFHLVNACRSVDNARCPDLITFSRAILILMLIVVGLVFVFAILLGLLMSQTGGVH